MDEVLNEFIPGEGDFSVAYFDHGIKPVDASCAFLISAHGVPASGCGAREGPGENRHCAYDTQAKTWIYGGIRTRNDLERVREAGSDGPSSPMLIQETGANMIQLAIASWDEKNKAPYTLALVGRWSVTQVKPLRK